MKWLVLLSLVISLSLAASGQAYYGSTDLKVFRDGRDKEFRDKEESPLKPEDFADFRGLNYFPVDSKFRVSAEFVATPGEKYFDMPTSSGAAKRFIKVGILKFQLSGKAFQLSVYQIDKAILDKFPEYADLLFVPFRDKTNKTDTYAGGRYIDIRAPKGKIAILDFNLAYNPNCAYGGDKYNCPIPPSENNLAVGITAGEKRYFYFGYERTH